MVLNPYNRRLTKWWLAICLTLLLSACSDDLSDETLIHQTFDTLEQAAQSRRIGDFMAAVDSQYSDKDGRDWKTIRGLAQIQFIRNRNLHLYKVIKQVDINGDDASAIVFLAAAGSPIDGAESLLNMQAELFRFDLGLSRQDDQWLITTADWRRIQAQDFLL